MRSFCTRSLNWYGPEHTGLPPGSLSNEAGEIIMPARSDSCDSSEASGSARCSTTVLASGASTLATVASSLLRLLSGSVRARSRLALTAAASIGVPSWNTASVRSLKVSVLLSALVLQD